MYDVYLSQPTVGNPRWASQGIRCKVKEGINWVNFNGTWGYNDYGSGNDFGVTCRNGWLTDFCATHPDAGRGANWNIFKCE